MSRIRQEAKRRLGMADILANDPFGLLGDDKPYGLAKAIAVLASGEVAKDVWHQVTDERINDNNNEG